MDKAIIFGCGYAGEGAYCKLCDMYEIIAWVDNNTNLWGKKKEGIEIISPLKMYELLQKNKEVTLFVAVVDSSDIVNQLKMNSIEDFYIWKVGFFFYNEKRGFLTNKTVRQKLSINTKSVLFVMNAIVGGIREYRLATVLKKYGYTIYLAYFTPTKGKTGFGFTDVYESIIPVMSLDDLMGITNEYDFEFVHSSSEPEWLTAFLLNSNKRIIHECHDLGSANVNMTPERLVMEYVSNVGARGVFYPTEALQMEAVQKFSIPKEKTFVVENLISESLAPVKYLKKLGEIDGKIHVVYEGSMTSTDELDKRYFEKIWLKLADAGVIVHFYTNHKQAYCEYLDDIHPNIIYEGNISSKELATEMTKYDVGLLLFNVNKRNKRYLESASPNKMYEYLNSGIPIATYGIDTYKDFVEGNNVGKEISLDGNIYQQFYEIKRIKIPNDILKRKKLTIESHEEEIICFINDILKGE